MSRIETKTGSVKLIPSGYTGNTNITVPSNVERSYTDADHTSTEVQWKITKGQTGSVYYTFPAANIRTDATITSITGRVRMRTYATNNPTSRYAQLYSGTTAKGSRITYQAVTGTNGTINNLSPGNVSNWSPSNFDNLRLYLQGYSNSANRYFSVYGADVTVEYSWTETYYTISASCNQYGTVSPTSEELLEGNDCTITLTPTVAGIAPSQVLDNGNDVTNLILEHNQGEYYTYELTGLSADHNIVVTFRVPVLHEISGTVDSNLTIDKTLPISVPEDEDFELEITPTKPGTITVKDNNVITETYEIQVGNYEPVTYLIEQVKADHVLNITFVELDKYTISGTIVSSLSISPSLPQTVYKGTNTIFIITPSEGGTITVNDNGIITTYGIPRSDVHEVEYIVNAISEAHTLTITFTPVQQFQISGTVDSHISISPSLPQSIYTGEDISFTLTPSAGGTITVNDNGDITEYNISRTDVHSVVYTIYAVSSAHTLQISYEPPQQFTISGTVSSGVTISPTLPQSVYTGDSLDFTLTPSGPGIIKVTDNDVLVANYEIPSSDVSAVHYSLDNIGESHTLNIVYETLPQYIISALEIEEGLTISPTLPIIKYLGDNQTLTITPNAGGQITILDNDKEAAIFYIVPENIHSVTYTISSISINHELKLKFSSLPEFTATATLTGTGNLSENTITEYAGRTITFTVTNVPSSNILIVKNNGENVSKKTTHSGTTYTYSFELVQDCNIEFISKVPGDVIVNAYIDEFGTLNPVSTTIAEGDEYTLQITPTDFATKPLSVSDNYEEVIDEVVGRKDTASPIFTATSHTTSGISSGEDYTDYCIGYTAEDPYESTRNCYSNSTGYAIYSFNVSSIPNDATIVNVSCKVNGHLENGSIQSNRFCRVQLYANTTAKGTVQNFPSTSNTTMELEDVGTWTRSEVENIKLRMEVGYYGGLVCGISLTIEYEVDKIRYYYTTTVYEETEIYVKYKPDFYVKVNRQWKGRTLTSLLPKVAGKYRKVKKIFIKIDDEWKSVD